MEQLSVWRFRFTQSVMVCAWLALTSGCLDASSPLVVDQDQASADERRDAPAGSTIDLTLGDVGMHDVTDLGDTADLGEATDLSQRDHALSPADQSALAYDSGLEFIDQEVSQEIDLSAEDMDLISDQGQDVTPLDMAVEGVDMEINPPEARCGDLQVDPGEMCDDGNRVTETCPYGARSCVVCDAQCQEVPGAVAFCGDGELSHHERCDEGEANSDVLPNGCRTDCHPDHRDALVPFLQESYIVQGVASSCESLETSECAEERVYLSLYFKDASGNDASEPGFTDRNSVIVELDPQSYPPLMITRCWSLSGQTQDSHVGGLAFAQTTLGERYLYVSGARKVERYRVPSLEELPAQAPDAIDYGSLDACDSLGGGGTIAWDVPASSFTSHVKMLGTDYLLVGQFCNGGDCVPRVYAYELDMNGGTIDNSAPDRTLVVRQKAQGVDVDGEDLYVSVSYGDNDSYIYRDDLSAALCPPSGCDAASVRNRRRLTVKGGVAGGEDLARVGSHLWSASESGSRYFQNRPVWQFPWSSYFPYVYDVAIGEAFSAPETSIEEAVNSRHARPSIQLLSGVYEAWWDRVPRIFSLDVNGDGHDDFVLGPDQDQGCWYLLEGGSSDSGRGILTDRGCVISAYSSWWNNTDRIRVMDVNGDERDDIVIGPYSQDGCWYVLQGHQTSAGADLIDRGCVVRYKDNWYNKSERIRPLDVNGDGADDLLIGPSSDGNWYLLSGQSGPEARFALGQRLTDASPSYGGWWNNPERIHVIDANGDGADDVVIGPHSETGCWYLLQGQAQPIDLIDRGCVVRAHASWYDNAERFWIADFNGDARQDILLGPSGANGNWYLLAGEGEAFASLNDEGVAHTRYQNWSDHARRVRVMQSHTSASASILIGPKQGSGEWQLLQGHNEGGFYDVQWAVNTQEAWGAEDRNQKPERIWMADLNGDGRDDIVIGPSSNGHWYLVESR